MVRFNRNQQQMTRLQRLNEKQHRADNQQKGLGLYLYKNNNLNASLNLPKPAQNEKGEKVYSVEGGQNFIGDDYFMMLVRSHDARLVRTIEAAIQPLATVTESVQPVAVETKGEVMVEDKLILDQPDQITRNGKVEHVKINPTPSAKKLNEEQPAKHATKDIEGDILLNDAPIDGLEILD